MSEQALQALNEERDAIRQKATWVIALRAAKRILDGLNTSSLRDEYYGVPAITLINSFALDIAADIYVELTGEQPTEAMIKQGKSA